MRYRALDIDPRPRHARRAIYRVARENLDLAAQGHRRAGA